MAEGRSIKVCVVGSGYWGKNIVRNLHALGALALVCDRSREVLDAVAAAYPGVGTAFTLREALARPDIDAVAVASPAETHYAAAREALLAGKHVFVEKPLALNPAEGEELDELAARCGLTLMVGHLMHYHPAFIRLKELADSGALGRLLYVYSNRLNLGKVRREENILWSFAPHDVSMILALAGETPEAVRATGGNYLHNRIADTTVTQLDFASGLKAHVFVSWLHPFKEQKFVAVGDAKMAVFDDTLPWEDKLLLYPHSIRWEHHAPVPGKAEPQRAPLDPAEPLRAELAHFLDCVAKGTRPVTDGPEGLRVLRVLMAAQASMDGGGDTVRLDAAPGRSPAKNCFVHPTAVVDEGAAVGEGTKIWHFTHVLAGSSIGRGCIIGQNVCIGPKGRVGNFCKIQNNVSIYPGVILEDGVFCGPSAVFTNVINPRARIEKKDQYRTTLVRENATIGANATIVCGNSIGRFALIGAGAVVTKSVPDHALMVGNPARRIGWVCACGETLGQDLTCPVCRAAYRENENGLTALQEPAGRTAATAEEGLQS